MISFRDLPLENLSELMIYMSINDTELLEQGEPLETLELRELDQVFTSILTVMSPLT